MNTIPFVIDNQQNTMADVLKHLLVDYKGRSLDIATAYFNIGGWHLLHEGLKELGSFRLLLGDEPELGADIGLREAGAHAVKGLIRELSEASFNQQTLRMVEELVAFLTQYRVQVRLSSGSFLHAKSYIFYGDSNFTRIAPLAAIVGSSNLTRAGLLTNKELNLVHRANFAQEEIDPERVRGIMEEDEREQIMDLAAQPRTFAANVPGLLALEELTTWYRQHWREARDFKAELIELLNASKFGRKEYTPYQIYTKAIFEYFRDELEAEDESPGTRSAVELSEFQEDAIRKARKILARYDGVLIADSVGLGKTWIGKKLLEDYAYHRRYKAIVICPASLQKMWREELTKASIAVTIVTQEMLGREGYDIHEVADADLLLIDESHNFRNHTTQRYENLERILSANNRRGALSHERKKLILLTATPINNDLFDLYHQINLFTGGDRAFFVAAGIGDLPRYFLAARHVDRQQESGIALFNLLEEVVIRRTRPFIKQAYPNATIQGKPIHWPERKLKTIRYHLEATYSGIYTRIVAYIENLRLAPYRLESYKQQGIERDTFEEGREDALAGIFKSRYLKRFESSIEAFRISVRRALEFLETFESYILGGKILDSSSFQRAMRYLAREDEEDDATTTIPTSRSEELDAHTEAQQFLASLPLLDAQQYDLKRLHNDVRKDVEALREVWHDITTITPEQDAKLARLKDLLAGDLKGQKVLIFTYYRDTARYLYKQLCSAEAEAVQWRIDAGEPHIRRMDSGADTRERARLVAAFAPRANNRRDIAGTSDEITILLSTDVLSEGQNLQDCGILINYDLHWNPTRMVQRAGRIDRIGTSFDTLWVMNMFPDDGLERLLGLVESLSQKIAAIDRSGLLDASILGEVVHPQNFNTLRRIEEEDGRVIEEQERFAELVSSEYLLQNLKGLLDQGMRQALEELPDGIHSGLLRHGARGVFFYFIAREKKKRGSTGKQIKENRTHYWRYIDLSESIRAARIEENRYLITNLIQCLPDAMRFVPDEHEINIFELQERVIASIILSSAEQSALDDVPKILEPIQETVAIALRPYLHNPLVRREEVVAALQKVNIPQPRVHIKTLKKAYQTFTTDGQVQAFIKTINSIGGETREDAREKTEGHTVLKREDLKLICFEYIWQ